MSDSSRNTILSAAIAATASLGVAWITASGVGARKGAEGANDAIEDAGSKLGDLQRELTTATAGIGQLRAALTQVALTVRSGQTVPNRTGWQPYENSTRGVYVDVDTRSAGFQSTPRYIASLHGTSSVWESSGGSGIYEPTAQGFRVYVRFNDGRPITPEDANKFGWHIVWVGLSDK